MTDICRTIRIWRIRPSLKTTFCLLTGLGLFTLASCGQMVRAVQFNQSANFFGTINLLDGGFTPLGGAGSTLFNDRADAPNGTLHGIINSASLANLKPGGTNLDGSLADLGCQLLTPSFPNNFSFSSSASFIVSVPEPGVILFSLMGGAILLAISHRRIRH